MTNKFEDFISDTATAAKRTAANSMAIYSFSVGEMRELKRKLEVYSPKTDEAEEIRLKAISICDQKIIGWQDKYSEEIAPRKDKKDKVINPWGYDTANRQQLIKEMAREFGLLTTTTMTVEEFMDMKLLVASDDSTISQIFVRGSRYWQFLITDVAKSIREDGIVVVAKSKKIATEKDLEKQSNINDMLEIQQFMAILEE